MERTVREDFLEDILLRCSLGDKNLSTAISSCCQTHDLENNSGLDPVPVETSAKSGSEEAINSWE